MKKQPKFKTPPVDIDSMKRYTFKEFGPVYVFRGEKEITCEPNGVAYYTLTDFGICENPSMAFFHAVDVYEFNAEDEDGKSVKLTAKEKQCVCGGIIEALDENPDIDLR